MAGSEHSVREESPVYSGALAPHGDSLPQLISRLKDGLPFSSFERLQDHLGVPAGELAERLQIASRTLARRREDGRLRGDESERLYRLAKLCELAIEILGSEDAARSWFTSPKRALGGVSALEFADTEPGAREVEALLHRIDHGVFS